MNKLPIILSGCLILFFSLHLRGHNDKQDDYTKFIITLSIGLVVNYGSYEVESSTSAFSSGSVLEGMMELRPIKQVGFATGIGYNNRIIKNRVGFYTIPLLLNFYSQDGFVVTGGPIFVLNANDKNIMDTSPVPGFMAGLRHNSFEISYRYLSSKYFTNDDGGTISRIIGMGFYFEIGLKMPISREPLKPVISFRFS